MNAMNKISYKILLQTTLLMLMALSLTGCKDDEATVPTYPVKLRSVGALEQTPVVKTLPAGYVAYNVLYDTPDDANSRIAVYMTQGSGSVSKTGEFRYKEGNEWTSNVGVRDGEDYYVYGFMPAGVATATVTSEGFSGFSEGATVQFTNMAALTTADVCMIVGALGDDNNVDITDASINIQPGKFAYAGKAEDNYMYLLVDHLYAKLDFEFTVDATYNGLRTIKLKQVEVKADDEDLNGKIDATVKLRANNTGANPIESITFTPKTSSTEKTPLMSGEEADYKTLDPVTITKVPGYFTPVSSAELTFEVTSTYDVYDKKGNLVRENCHAANKIAISSLSVGRGRSTVIKMQVVPTYLYQLSEPELDNPTIKTLI